MKAIIFTNELDANEALARCSQGVTLGPVTYEGQGPFLEPDPDKPYSTIIKHPMENMWALIADDHVEDVLNRTAEEIDSSWFPQSAMS